MAHYSHPDLPDALFDWLMEGDPAIRYATLRDFTDAFEEAVRTARLEITYQGWGADLLEKQDPEGTWAGGLYGPKWISTHYTLMLLRRLGLDPENAQARKAAQLLLDKGFYEKDGGINHFTSMEDSETCVTGMELAMFSYFRLEDPRIHLIANHLLAAPLGDGGWNCNAYKGHTHHSSFHTTTSVLEGLMEYVNQYPDRLQEVQPVMDQGREFLLQHHLFRSDRTGKIVDVRMTRLSFPPRWKHDILKILEIFAQMDAPWDPRCQDAINLLRKKEKDGKWPVQQKHAGRVWFELEPTGKPSRINTLRVLRVLRWWESGMIA